MRAIDDQNRYFDHAIRLSVVDRSHSGKLEPVAQSQVFGGKWDRWARSYVAPPETALPITISVKQFEILESALRLNSYTKVDGGRGFGKSTIATVCGAIFAVSLPTGAGMITSPTYEKTQIMWGKFLGPDVGISSLLVDGGILVKDRILLYKTGHIQSFKSTHKASSGRGWDSDYVIHDERQDSSQEAVNAARLQMRKAGGFREIQIGTPDMATESYQEYLRFKALNEAGNDRYRVFSATSYDNPFITHQIFEDSRHSVDSRYYRQEVLGLWVLLGGRCYPAFDRKVHVREIDPRLVARTDITARVLEEKFDEVADYVIGLDYNAAPMVATVGKILDDRREGTLYELDEVVIEEEADAQKMAAELKARGYENAVVFDDASGQYSKGGRAPSAILRKAGFRVVHRRKNPKVKDRVASVRAKLKAADGFVSTVIHPRCKMLIECLEQQQEGTDGTPDKTQGKDHANDAHGYKVHKLWPVTQFTPDQYQVAA